MEKKLVGNDEINPQLVDIYKRLRSLERYASFGHSFFRISVGVIIGCAVTIMMILLIFGLR